MSENSPFGLPCLTYSPHSSLPCRSSSAYVQSWQAGMTLQVSNTVHFLWHCTHQLSRYFTMKNRNISSSFSLLAGIKSDSYKSKYEGIPPPFYPILCYITLFFREN